MIKKMNFDKRKSISIIISIIVTIIIIIIINIPYISRSINISLSKLRLNRTLQTGIKVFGGIIIALGTFLITYKTSTSIIKNEYS